MEFNQKIKKPLHNVLQQTTPPNRLKYPQTLNDPTISTS